MLSFNIPYSSVSNSSSFLSGVVLSWAVPGQAGYNHVNTRSNDHVKSKMADRGLVADDEAEKRIREAVEIGWFKNTIMVLRFPGERC